MPMGMKQGSDAAQKGPGVGRARVSPKPYKRDMNHGYGTSGENAQPGNRNKRG